MSKNPNKNTKKQRKNIYNQTTKNTLKISSDQEIMERDNYTCQWGHLCEAKQTTPSNLVVLRFPDNQAITLCKDCNDFFRKLEG